MENRILVYDKPVLFSVQDNAQCIDARPAGAVATLTPDAGAELHMYKWKKKQKKKRVFMGAMPHACLSWPGSLHQRSSHASLYTPPCLSLISTSPFLFKTMHNV